MKKLITLFGILALSLTTINAQENCFERLENAFKERGSYTVSDDIHRNIIVTFFEDGEAFCLKGKARVENGRVSSIFLYYDDNTSELFDKPFFNKDKEPPVITNGISEMIYTQDKERLRVVFIEKLKPKQKAFKKAELPDDL